MRRKKGTLIPIEVSVLEAALDVRARGQQEFHGFLLAKLMRERAEAKRLTAHGTLYRALNRMAEAGYLESWREDVSVAARENRPLRRLYRVTASGERALAESHAASESGRAILRVADSRS